MLFDGTDAASGDVQVLTLDELADRGKARLAAEPDVVDNRIAGCGPEDLATLIYTSGTTGRPKGVRLVHDNWTYEGKAVAALGILGPDDVQYLWLPMSHVLGKVLSAVQLEFGFSHRGRRRPDEDRGEPGRHQADVHGRRTADLREGAGQGHAHRPGARRAEGEDLRLGDRGGDQGIPGSAAAQAAVPAAGRCKLAVADKLVFGTIRDRLGGRIRFFVSGSAALSREVAEWFDAVGMPILRGLRADRVQRRCRGQPAG